MRGARNRKEEWNEQTTAPPCSGSSVNKEPMKYAMKISVDMQEVDVALEKFREMERIFDKIHKGH